VTCARFDMPVGLGGATAGNEPIELRKRELAALLAGCGPGPCGQTAPSRAG